MLLKGRQLGQFEVQTLSTKSFMARRDSVERFSAKVVLRVTDQLYFIIVIIMRRLVRYL